MGKMVVGRDIELTAIDRFLDALPRGSSTLLIEGTAGIGKTTILQTALRRAETDPGYAPGPGHSGTGRIVAVFCQ